MHTPSGPRLTQAQVRAALRKIWPVLAPEVPLPDYSHKILRYRLSCLDRVSPLRFEDGEPTEEQLEDSRARYEQVAYRYRSGNNAAAALESGKPSCLIGWHHGAREHFAYGLMKAFPQLAFFTMKKLQFGDFLTRSMEDAGPLTLLQMRAALKDGQPIFQYLDGPPSGQTVEAEMLGHQSRFSLAPLRMLCRFPDIQIIPVTSRYHTPDEVYIRLYDPVELPEPGPDREVRLVEMLLDILTANLRKFAPEQALVRMLPYRENLAREMNELAEGKKSQDEGAR